MGGLGCGCGLVAALLAVVTAIPFLGWANWILTLPVAGIAVILSIIGMVRDDNRSTALLGLILGVGVFFWAMFRLALGHGII